MMLERWSQGVKDVWSYFFGGPEDEIRAREDRTLSQIRERRQRAREALAERKERDARRKRDQARLAASESGPSPVENELLEEAAQEETTAQALRDGEIGLLEAMGLGGEYHDGEGGDYRG